MAVKKFLNCVLPCAHSSLNLYCNCKPLMGDGLFET